MTEKDRGTLLRMTGNIMGQVLQLHLSETGEDGKPMRTLSSLREQDLDYVAFISAELARRGMDRIDDDAAKPAASAEPAKKD